MSICRDGRATSRDAAGADPERGAPAHASFDHAAARMGDRTLSNFYLNQGRTTLGLNIAPAPSVIFKLNYILNHTFGPVPNIAGSIGGADFGNNPLPHLDYGKNGFTGSVAYVF